MGCTSSKQTRSKAVELQKRLRRQVAVSEPTGGPVLVPLPYRDKSGRPIKHTSSELDSDTIEGALHDVAAYLDQNQVRAQLVTVGGVVNTLYLRSRQSTHDVDFFFRNPSSSTNMVIHKAARFANRQRGGRLGAEWLNNATQLLMPTQLQSHLFDAAVEQGTVVFESGGLRVYAAPWPYALCGKLNRLCTMDSREYDLADATVYLHEYLRTSRRPNVGVGEIQLWCQRFSKSVTGSVLQQLDEAYQEEYGRQAIDWHA